MLFLRFQTGECQIYLCVTHVTMLHMFKFNTPCYERFKTRNVQFSYFKFQIKTMKSKVTYNSKALVDFVQIFQ